VEAWIGGASGLLWWWWAGGVVRSWSFAASRLGLSGLFPSENARVDRSADEAGPASRCGRGTEQSFGEVPSTAHVILAFVVRGAHHLSSCQMLCCD
jgi:hypothetical protein